MLISIAVLVLLYAIEPEFAVPPVCFVLTWASAIICFIALEVKLWKAFQAGKKDGE